MPLATTKQIWRAIKSGVSWSPKEGLSVCRQRSKLRLQPIRCASLRAKERPDQVRKGLHSSVHKGLRNRNREAGGKGSDAWSTTKNEVDCGGGVGRNAKVCKASSRRRIAYIVLGVVAESSCEEADMAFIQQEGTRDVEGETRERGD